MMYGKGWTNKRYAAWAHTRGRSMCFRRAARGLLVDISVSVYQTEGMRTTVTLDNDVYEAAIHLSHASGERLGKVLSTLARRGLKPEGAAARGSKRRFPVFDIPANAPVIPASRIQRIIDEEGLY